MSFFEELGLDGSTTESRILIVLVTILLVLTFPLTLAIWLTYATFTVFFGVFWHIFIEPIRWIIVGGSYGDGYALLLKKYDLLKVPT